MVALIVDFDRAQQARRRQEWFARFVGERRTRYTEQDVRDALYAYHIRLDAQEHGWTPRHEVQMQIDLTYEDGSDEGEEMRAVAFDWDWARYRYGEGLLRVAQLVDSFVYHADRTPDIARLWGRVDSPVVEVCERQNHPTMPDIYRAYALQRRAPDPDAA